MKSIKGPIASVIVICALLGTATAQEKQETTQPKHAVSDMFFQRIAHLGSGGFVDATLVKEVHRLPRINAVAMFNGFDPGAPDCSTAGNNCPIGDTFCDCAGAQAIIDCGGD